MEAFVALVVEEPEDGGEVGVGEEGGGGGREGLEGVGDETTDGIKEDRGKG